MTKKEFHQKVNKTFYLWIEKYYPDYNLDFEEGGGRVNLIPIHGYYKYTGDNIIEYHQSRHEIDCANWSEEKTQKVTKDLQKVLSIIIFTITNL